MVFSTESAIMARGAKAAAGLMVDVAGGQKF